MIEMNNLELGGNRSQSQLITVIPYHFILLSSIVLLIISITIAVMIG